MTFDDGILQVYRTENTAENGAMPRETQTLLSEHYFGYDVLASAGTIQLCRRTRASARW